MEEEVGGEELPASDFDAAADAVASELGATPTPALRRALREMVMACMDGGGDYAAEEPEAAKGKEGLALVFGGK